MGILQQVEAVQIFERISAHARDAVGIEEKQLEGCEAVEDSSGKFAEPVSVQDPITRETEETWDLRRNPSAE